MSKRFESCFCGKPMYADIGMTSAGREVSNKKLYGGSTRVLRNFAIGNHTYLTSPTEPSRVVMEYFSSLLRVPSVGGFRIVLKRNMAARLLRKCRNEFLAGVRLIIIVLAAGEHEHRRACKFFIRAVARRFWVGYQT